MACSAEVGGGGAGAPAGNGAPSGSASSTTSSADGSTTAGTGSGSTGTGGASSGTSSVTAGTTGSGTSGQTLVPFEAPTGPLRRLTRAQFGNAVRDLTGAEVDESELEADSYNGAFAAVGASTVTTSELGVERYHEAIEAAVDDVFADDQRRAQFIGCTPTAATDACVSDFLSTLGRRAWRRPLEASELARLVGVAETATTELESATEGVRWATVALLTSPNFLYRPELGTGGGRLTDYELASRMAFLIWNSGPDEQLLDAAETGVLATVDGVRSTAERLLDAPAGREAVGAFAEDYMRQDRILTQAKDASMFPEYGPELQAAMVRDMRETWTIVAFDNDANVLDLFSTPTVYANAELAQLYGLDAQGLDSNTFRELTLPNDTPRVGILGKGGFLSQFANQKEGSPTLRGKFIREALMCQHIDPPPPGVSVVIPESADGTPMTKRQRLEMHRTSAVCASCHGLMDPMGLPLESFDAIGRYRTTDQGLPIDPSGEFDGTPVADARELGMAMSISDRVAACIVRKYYSYAVGHEDRDVDEVVVQELSQSFDAAGRRFRPLILDVVSHDAFAAVAPQL